MSVDAVAAAPEAAPGRAVSAADFAHPFTRRLLSHRGLTTPLLEERVGGPLALRLVGQDLRATAPRHLLALLGLDRGRPCLVRRTELVGADGTVVSRNLVVGRAPRRPDLAGIVTSDSVPLGRSLLCHGTHQDRTLLAVGRSPWPSPAGPSPAGPAPTPAARRSYLLLLDHVSPLYVRELFHPDVAPPTEAAP